jgi:hypothetical protein
MAKDKLLGALMRRNPYKPERCFIVPAFNGEGAIVFYILAIYRGRCGSAMKRLECGIKTYARAKRRLAYWEAV